MEGAESSRNLRPSFDWADITEKKLRITAKQDESIKKFADSAETQRQDLSKRWKL